MRRRTRSLLAPYGIAWLMVLGTVFAERGLRIARNATSKRALALLEADPSRRADLWSLDADTDLWLEKWKRYRPGAEVATSHAGVDLQVRINAQGYRGSDFATPKTPGRIRIVCIGGSTTFQGIRDDITYPALLEQALRDSHPALDLEVLNLGISGTRSDHWVGAPFQAPV